MESTVRTRDLLIIGVCVVAAGALLVGAGTQLDSINAQREKMKIVINPALENAPPSLVFATVAMGAFRGLVVDILWMRADKLKDEGQFFDARQLAEWITTLQPRFSAVWEFQAWNMAYNISVAIPASQPEQRWQWVKNGYELLRDKGIPLNPKAISLYREMGRIFQHKMGGVSDDAHEYYKLQLAEAMGPLLESADNGLSGADNRYFEALMRAPVQWARIARDPNTAQLIQALRTADGAFASDKDFVRNYLSLRHDTRRFKPEAAQVLEVYRGSEALKKFDIFAKAYQLREEWKLDPALMYRVSQMYGPVDFTDPNKHFPLDWRHPDSHAIYWAVKALDVAAQDKDRDLTMDEVNTDRMVLHSLQNLFRYGKIMILQGPVQPAGEGEGQGQTATAASAPMQKNIFLGPDLRIFDSYRKAYLQASKKYAGDPTRADSYDNGYRNMLKNAVFTFYQAGIKGYALRIYNELRQRYPTFKEFSVTLDQYARDRLREELDGFGIQDASEMIASTLMDSYHFYAIRDDDAAAVRERFARQAYDYYLAKYPDEKQRIGLPEMRILRWYALRQFLGNEAYPLYVRQGLLERIKLERPDIFKQLEQTEDEWRQMEPAENTGTP
jgi:hypothetical protein